MITAAQLYNDFKFGFVDNPFFQVSDTPVYITASTIVADRFILGVRSDDLSGAPVYTQVFDRDGREIRLSFENNEICVAIPGQYMLFRVDDTEQIMVTIFKTTSLSSDSSPVIFNDTEFLSPNLIKTGVIPGVYGDSQDVGQFTVDEFGRITLAANIPIGQSKQGLIVAGTGLEMGGKLQINGGDNTKFDVLTGQGRIVDNTTDVNNPVFTAVTWPDNLAITPQGLATQNATYVMMDSLGVSMQLQFPSESDRRQRIFLGAVIHSNHVIVNVVNNIPAVALDPTNQLNDLMYNMGPFAVFGLGITPASAGTMNISKAAGKLFRTGVGFQTNPRNPHTVDFVQVAVAPFRYRRYDGNEGPDTSNIDPTQYDSGGALSPVLPGQYTNQRVFIFPSGMLRLQWGQQVYASLSAAKDGLLTETFIKEENIAENGLLRAIITLKGDATDLIDALQAGFMPASRFGDVSPAGGSGFTLINWIEGNNSIPPNDVTPIVFFFPNIGTVNAGVGLLPKGNGPILAQIPQSDISSGNIRGAHATDFQRKRTAAIQVASGDGSTISGGRENAATNSDATIGGGAGNTASGSDSTVAGGFAGTAAGNYSFVGGGQINSAGGFASGIVVGQSNVIDLVGSNHSFIGGGESNEIHNHHGVVGGGFTNIITGPWAYIGGGSTNIASASLSFVGGGFNNQATGVNAVVVGGANNAASGIAASVGGGTSQIASGDNAVVAGGFNNVASGSLAVISGGNDHVASGDNSTVSGGNTNKAQADYATVGGGANNTHQGIYGAIPGGRGALATVDGSFAYSSSEITTPGDAQWEEFVLAANTVDATPTEMTVGAQIVGAANRIIYGGDVNVAFQGLFTAKQDSGGVTRASIEFKGSFWMGATGATAVIDNLSFNGLYNPDGIALAITAADGGGVFGLLRVVCTGIVAKNIKHVILIRTIKTHNP